MWEKCGWFCLCARLQVLTEDKFNALRNIQPKQASPGGYSNFYKCLSLEIRGYREYKDRQYYQEKKLLQLKIYIYMYIRIHWKFYSTKISLRTGK
jgi:hypothetical protein